MDCKLLISNILFLLLGRTNCSNTSQVESLYFTLFETYNRELFPLINHNDTVKISCTVRIVSINNFDELSGEIDLTMLFSLQWIDERLTWTPSDFGGKFSLVVSPKIVWHPHLYVVQSVDNIQEISKSSMMVRILSSGLATWNPGTVLKSICSVDVTYFPFDTQTCQLTVTGTAYTTDEVNFYTTNSVVNEDTFSLNSQWKIESSTLTNSSSLISFPPTISIQLKLKRRSTFFVTYIICPVLFLGSINILVFVMPVNSGERTSVAITTFLSFIVFMQMINNTVPESSSPMAYIYYYILFLLVYSSVIIFLCVLSLCIYDNENPVPPAVKRLIFFLRFWWWTRKKKSIVMPERKGSSVSKESEKKNFNFQEDQKSDKDYQSSTINWKIVGKTFDMYCCSALLTTFVVKTIVTFTNLYNNGGF